jgi:hypothetical protein
MDHGPGLRTPATGLARVFLRILYHHGDGLLARFPRMSHPSPRIRGRRPPRRSHREKDTAARFQRRRSDLVDTDVLKAGDLIENRAVLGHEHHVHSEPLSESIWKTERRWRPMRAQVNPIAVNIPTKLRISAGLRGMISLGAWCPLVFVSLLKRESRHRNSDGLLSAIEPAD